MVRRLVWRTRRTRGPYWLARPSVSCKQLAAYCIGDLCLQPSLSRPSGWVCRPPDFRAVAVVLCASTVLVACQGAVATLTAWRLPGSCSMLSPFVCHTAVALCLYGTLCDCVSCVWFTE